MNLCTTRPDFLRDELEINAGSLVASSQYVTAQQRVVDNTGHASIDASTMSIGRCST